MELIWNKFFAKMYIKLKYFVEVTTNLEWEWFWCCCCGTWRRSCCWWW
jgi:hypothetical protein